MALVLADRVKDTTTTTGTGTVTLSGTAPSGFQNFSVIGNGNTTYYTLVSGSAWEVGIGTYSSTGPTLSRDTVLSSSASGSKITLSGTSDVFVTLPSERVGVLYTPVKTSNYNANVQDGVQTNTSGGAFTVTLPASPAAGDQVVVVDSAGTWATNNLTIGRNGSTIEGLAENLVCDISGVSVQLVYSGTTWDVYAQVGGAGAGVISVSGGGTGVSTLTGYVKGSGTSPLTASATIPVSDLSGTLSVASGGTGATTLSSAYLLKGNGTSAVSASIIYDNGTNVGIGTNGPSYRLQVNASSGSNQVAYFVNDSTGSSLAGVFSSINSGGNNTSSFHYAGVTQGVALWYLYGNGTTSYTSDLRVKKNIETTRDGYLEDVCNLRVVKYNWYTDTDDTPRELGFIAQEVEEVFPGLVQDAMHPTKDGEIHKVLKASVLTPILVKALQEANEKIEALIARVAQLESN